MNININEKLFEKYITSIKNNNGVKDARYLALKKSLEYNDKNICYLSDIEMRDLLINKFCINNSHSLNNYRSAYYNYINWYIANISDDKVFGNIFDESLLLSTKALKAYMTKNVKIYTNKDIEVLCNSINDNRNYIKCIILGAYEGIPSITDMAKLTINNINFNEKTIEIDDYKIKISDDLCFCLEENRHTNIWYQSNGKKRLLELPDDNYIFSFIPNKKTTDDISTRILSVRVFISKITTKLNIDLTEVYMSGFVNYLISNIGKETFISYYNTKKHDISQLNYYANQYGLKYTGKNLTHMLQPYMLKLKFDTE